MNPSTLMAFAVLLATPFLFGQEAAAPIAAVTPEGPQAPETLLDMFKAGGFMMWVLFASSIVAVTVLIERAISLRKSVVVPEGFTEDMIQTLTSPKEGIEACRKAGHPLARMLRPALKALPRGAEDVEDALEDSGGKEVDRMHRSIRPLAVVAGVAPLMGLIGTIFGIMKAFKSFTGATSVGTGRTAALTVGIYEALVTTAAGLLIAIPTLLLHHWYTHRVDRLADRLDEEGEKFMDAVHTLPATSRRNTSNRSRNRGGGSRSRSKSSSSSQSESTNEPAGAGT